MTLSRQDVLTAAATLLDEVGIDGLSMRSLAKVLGTGPATLYWHVRDRDELLAAVLDETLREVAVLRTGTWRERLTALAESVRTVLLPRPALVAVLWGAGWRLGPVTLRLADDMLGLVAHSGLPDDEVADAYLAVLWFVLGFVHAESSADENTGYRSEAGPERLADYPNLARFDPSTDATAMHRRFRTGLDHLLAGIERQVHTEGEVRP